MQKRDRRLTELEMLAKLAEIYYASRWDPRNKNRERVSKLSICEAQYQIDSYNDNGRKRGICNEAKPSAGRERAGAKVYGEGEKHEWSSEGRVSTVPGMHTHRLLGTQHYYSG